MSKHYRCLRVLLSLCLLVTGLGYAREDRSTCGTTRERWKEQLHIHWRSERLRQLRQRTFGPRGTGSAAAMQVAPATRDIGEVVVMEDGDGVVAGNNSFDLAYRTITFRASAAAGARYSFETGGAAYDPALADAGAHVTGLGDDDTREVDLPFSFPFFGAWHDSVYINSDGNLTFTAGDASSSERSLGRMTAGPPRIAALFRDLDPSVFSGGVRVLSQPGRFVVSWVQVREYNDWGLGLQQTFQISLFPDGQIELAYATITSTSAVVGISPGGLKGSTSVVAFAEGSTQEFSSTIAERFGGTSELDIVRAAQKFYEEHEDAYDYLVFFNSLELNASQGAVAYEITVRSQTKGNGDLPIDVGRELGSAERLKAVINMGPLSQYPVDPNAPIPGRPLSRESTLGVLAHEVGHLFLAYASVRDPFNGNMRPMLGRQLAHWSFVFNSEASLLEGNRIEDRGAGASPRYTTVGNTEWYSPLDQYLMGLRPAEEVPPVFVVSPASVSGSRSPQAGVSFNGTRVDVHVGDIIAAEGRRTPDHTVAQRRFRVGFVLVVPAGTEPPVADVARVENIRSQFESFFHAAVSERASVDTTLRRSLRLSTAPAAGVVQGRQITTSLRLEKPAETPLSISIRTAGNLVEVPSVLVMPEGTREITFEIRGLTPGVEQLTAEPADSRYETAISRLQVAESAQGLTLEKLPGGAQGDGSQLIRFRVRDVNELPYPGLAVRAAVTEGGALDSETVVTDEQGMASFQWTPGPDIINELRATLEGTEITAITTAPGRPAFELAGVVNAASYQPGLSPGSLGSIFGVNLAGGAYSAAGLPWPTSLAGVRVLVNGVRVPLLLASDWQLNFLLPADTREGPAELVVTTPAGISAPLMLEVETVSPGLFFDPFTGFGAILFADDGLSVAERSAVPGEAIEIYATGLGPGTQKPNLFGQTPLPVRIFIADVLAPVTFTGLVPGVPGLYRVDARVPDGAPSGMQTLRAEVGTKRSNEVKILLK